MTHSLDQRIGFIGAGQMSRALGKGLVESNLIGSDQILAADPSAEALREFEATTGGTTTDTNARVIAQSDVVFLAVKPQNLASATSSLGDSASPDILFISILAGTRLSELTNRLGTDRVIRVMPNTPCLIAKGASAFCLANGATEDDAKLAQTILEAVGVARHLPEPLLDAVTGLSGSGPAYAFQMIESLSDGAVRMGLPRETATLFAAQTLYGAAAMVLETHEHPGVLKDRVASPGGTTIAGLHALEAGGMPATIMNAVQAATLRSRELGNS